MFAGAPWVVVAEQLATGVGRGSAPSSAQDNQASLQLLAEIGFQHNAICARQSP
jgi:hypothetical protein